MALERLNAKYLPRSANHHPHGNTTLKNLKVNTKRSPFLLAGKSASAAVILVNKSNHIQDLPTTKSKA
jgi:hypothetical protein